MITQLEVLNRVLDPSDNVAGGGAASAIAGAMAAALIGMAARLSVRRGLSKPDTFYGELAAEAETLSADLIAGADEDARAFGAVRAACMLPKETEAQKTERSQAIQAALVHATRVPLSNAERCKRVSELTRRLRGRVNVNVNSDVECASLLARAALLGSLSNIEANLRSVADEAVKSSLAWQAARMRQTSELSW
jgi:formiminotetrahydrofolate cyclodeaminase